MSDKGLTKKRNDIIRLLILVILGAMVVITLMAMKQMGKTTAHVMNDIAEVDIYRTHRPVERTLVIEKKVIRKRPSGNSMSSVSTGFIISKDDEYAVDDKFYKRYKKGDTVHVIATGRDDIEKWVLYDVNNAKDMKRYKEIKTMVEKKQ